MHDVTYREVRPLLKGTRSDPTPAGVARFFRHLSSDRLALVASIFFLLVVLVAVLAPLFAPGYNRQAGRRLTTRVGRAAPVAHPFGTDEQGQDVLARMMWGGQVTLRVGFVVVLVAGAVGIALG